MPYSYDRKKKLSFSSECCVTQFSVAATQINLKAGRLTWLLVSEVSQLQCAEPVAAHCTTSDCVAEKILLHGIQEVKEDKKGPGFPNPSLRVHPNDL